VKRVLILGGSGLLGSYLVNYFRDVFEVVYSFNNQNTLGSNFKNGFFLNALDHQSVEECVIKYKPDFILNAVALANVDEVQKRDKAGHDLNVIFPLYLSKISMEYNCKLIHVSTDHFAAKPSVFMKEIDMVDPVNLYGIQKLEAEKGILFANSSAIVLRTNFFRADIQRRRGLLEWLIYRLKRNEPFDGFTNVSFTPISCKILGDSIIKLLDVNYSGLINVSASESITKYDFAVAVAKTINADLSLINPCDIEDRVDLVSRPKNMCLDNSKFLKVTGFKVPSITDMIQLEIKSRDKVE
jgi:dTDP-4-dehydrorhamnose reductase